MFSLNRVSLIGYQTQPVDLRRTPGGTSVTDLNIVVPYAFRAADGKETAGKSFHVVTLWGAMADVAGQFVKVGSHIFIAGRLQTDSWEDEQTKEKKSRTKIVGNEMILLDPKDGQRQAPAGMKMLGASLNRVDVIGNVTRDPELRTTGSGQHVLTLGVASNERWKDRQSGEAKERTEFHNVVVWGPLAEETQRAIKKGNRVYVSGRVQTRSFETQAGAKKYATEIIADVVSLLGVSNPSAAEAFRADAMVNAPMKRVEQSAAPQNDPVLAGIPDINYESEVKVEDLPF